MKIGRMISLSWFGGSESKDVVARQVAEMHQQVDGVWLCVECEGNAPAEQTQMVELKIDQREELELSQLFYEECLTPLFHHLRKGFSFNQHHYFAYRRWNKALAEALAALYKEGDILWLHDAHWIPLARYIRELQPSMPIAITFNTPFPGAEVLKTLPVANEIIEDLFHFDLVGFSRSTDLAGFNESASDIVGALTLADKRLKMNSQMLKAAVYPAVVAEQNRCSESESQRQVNTAFQMFSGDKLVASLDTPCWFSNFSNRNQAYEVFLKENATLAKDVVFGSAITPYAVEAAHVKSTVHRWKSSLSELNDHWKSYSRRPFRAVNLYGQSFTDQLEVPALLRHSKVFLDMSMSCYGLSNHADFWTHQNPQDPGVLIVSSLAIDGNDLEGALVVHPLDIVGIARAVKEALLMPLSERKVRYEKLGAVYRGLSAERRRTKFTFDLMEQSRKNRQAASASRGIEPIKTPSERATMHH